MHHTLSIINILICISIFSPFSSIEVQSNPAVFIDIAALVFYLLPSRRK
jgi:hypothetical protein